MKKHLMLYIDMQENNLDNVVGVHGYHYTDNEIKVQSSKKPNNTRITNVGYLLNADLKKVPNIVIAPLLFIDYYKRYTESRDVTIVKTLLKIIKYVRLFKIDTVYIATNNVTLLKILKSDIEALKINLAINETLFRHLKFSLDKFNNFNYRRVYDYETNIGLNRAHEAILVSNNVKKNIFFKISNIKYYWSPQNNRHPMFRVRHLIFVNKLDDRPKYYLANYKKDDPIGLRTNYVVYYTILLREPIKVINDIKHKFLEILGDTEVVCTINLDNLYNPTLLSLFNIYENDIYIINTDIKLSIDTIFGLNIAHEIKPVGLAGYGIKNCHIIEKVLIDYLSYKKTGNTTITYVDITDVLYDINGKQTIKKDISDSFKFTVTIDEDKLLHNKGKSKIKIRALVGLDTPSRNSLKKIEIDNPKILLAVYINSGVIVESYCIVDYADGSELLASVNIYSNKLPLKLK